MPCPYLKGNDYGIVHDIHCCAINKFPGMEYYSKYCRHSGYSGCPHCGGDDPEDLLGRHAEHRRQQELEKERKRKREESRSDLSSRRVELTNSAFWLIIIVMALGIFLICYNSAALYASSTAGQILLTILIGLYRMLPLMIFLLVKLFFEYFNILSGSNLIGNMVKTVLVGLITVVVEFITMLVDCFFPFFSHGAILSFLCGSPQTAVFDLGLYLGMHYALFLAFIALGIALWISSHIVRFIMGVIF